MNMPLLELEQKWHLESLDPQFKEKMTEKEATDLAVKAVRSATMRDSFSGDGIDVLVVNKDGMKEFTEQRLIKCYIVLKISQYLSET